MLKTLVVALAAMVALPREGSAQGCVKGCAASKIFVQVGSTPPQQVKKMAGGAVSGVVEVDPPDMDGVARKKLAPDAISNDIYLTFDTINAALVELIDAFLDGRRVVVDLIIADQNFKDRARTRASDVQVLSISMLANAASKDDCRFQVTLRPRTILKVTAQQLPISVSGNPVCRASNTRLTLGATRIDFRNIDSLELRGSWIKNDVGTGFTFPNLRVVTYVPDEDILRDWYERTVVFGQVAAQTERSMSLEFLPPNLQPPALLKLDARGVGIVAMRRTVDSGNEGLSEFELYVEEWDRAGRARPAPLPAGAPAGSGGGPPPATSGTGGGESGSGPPAKRGSFRVQLPTAVLTGDGALCAMGADVSAFVIQLNGTGGVGLIGGQGQRLRVGTFAVGAESDSTIQVAFSRANAGVNAYTAKRGTLTITRIGARTSGTFRVVADVLDETGEPKEANIEGSFTDLPKQC